MPEQINWNLRPHIWMESSTENYFRPAIEEYVNLLLERILPIFSDPDTEQEKASNEYLSARSWGPDHDYGIAMENAYHYGIERGLMLLQMKSVFLATSVAGLFHLFEKQVYTHLKKELRLADLRTGKGKHVEINNWNTAEEIIRYFKESTEVSGQTLLEALESPDLKELREVANAVKHGEGRAIQTLKKMNAVVVDPSRLDADGFSGEYSILGVALSIEVSDVIRYREAIFKFWQVRGRFYAL